MGGLIAEKERERNTKGNKTELKQSYAKRKSLIERDYGLLDYMVP